MLGFRKAKDATLEEPSFYGWRLGPLESLFARLAGDHPNVNLGLTGFEHIIHLKGHDYRSALKLRRGDIDEYEKCALAFDERPRSEDDITFSVAESKLVGWSSYPAARAEGTFAVASGKSLVALQDGQVGHLWLSSNDRDDRSYRPLVKFHFHVLSVSEHEALRDSLRLSLNRGGSTWINFILDPIKDAAAEIAKFKERGYSSHFPINSAYFGSQVGDGPFD